MMQEDSRELYPRGLLQPKSGFRFSVDALLLSSHPRMGKRERILDLGCGCGVIGFGLLLQHEDKGIHITGVEMDSEMADCARENARMLEMEHGFSVCELDVKNLRKSQFVSPESFDRVVLNPPYRKQGEGRISPKREKNIACFEGEAGLGDFLQGAAYALKNRGRVNVVYPANSQTHLLQTMLEYKLEPKRMRFVHSRSGDAAVFVLVEGMKNGGRGVTVQPPLFLYSTGKNMYSEQALEYCPFLKCNSNNR